MIRYRMDKAAGGRDLYDHYTLAEIKQKGGVCVDQAYFASMTAKANGIPAMTISGEGDRGAHAWFGYEESRTSWNLSTGRYKDNYAAGTTRDPQTHRTIKEQELRELAAPARRTPAWGTTERYLQLSDLLREQRSFPRSRVWRWTRRWPRLPSIWARGTGESNFCKRRRSAPRNGSARSPACARLSKNTPTSSRASTNGRPIISRQTGMPKQHSRRLNARGIGSCAKTRIAPI